MNREIITFQIGNYSNYIGAHFWNIQQSSFVFRSDSNCTRIPDVNHDVLFREGLDNQSQVTFTPRLISIDYKDAINTIKVGDDERQNGPKLSTWKGKVDEIRSEENQQIQVDKDGSLIDEHIRYWSDYSKVKYHTTRTVSLIPKLKASKNEDFDLYHYGCGLNEDLNFFEEIENKLRFYAEGCDQMQGFHYLVDAFNGFGGLAQKHLRLIAEEYPKKPILAFFSFPFMNEDQLKYEAQTIRAINTALTLNSFMHESKESIVVPLSVFSSFAPMKQQVPLKLSNLDYKPHLDYHTSALLASLIDCTSLPYRQKSQITNLNDIFNRFDNYKYKICALKAQYPFVNDKYLFNYLQENDVLKSSDWFSPLCNEHSSREEIHSQVVCCRGIDDSQVKNPRDFLIYKETAVPAYQVLDTYFNEVHSSTISKSFSMQDQLSVQMPFPDIFPHLKQTVPKQKHISMLTSLQQTNKIQNWLQSLVKTLESTKIKQFNRYFDNGLEMDDYSELINEQHELCDIYNF